MRQPDLTVWFDLDPLIAAERLASARVPDKFESQPTAFFAAVRAGYARRQTDMPERFVMPPREGTTVTEKTAEAPPAAKAVAPAASHRPGRR